MRKDFLHSAALLMLAASAVGLTACSSDEDAGTTGKDHVLTIAINLPKQALTRATDLGTADVSNENNVNNLFIAICKKDPGNILKTTTLFTKDGNTIKAEMTNAQMVAGDEVLVALNEPDGRFDDATLRSDFNAAKVTSDEALARTTAAAGKIDFENFPMYGKATLTTATGGSQTDLEAKVEPYRLVSKIIINSITADFTGDANYKDAVFEPIGYYIMNSADKAKFDVTTTVGATDACWYDGDDQSYHLGWYTTAPQYKAYLGTSSVTASDVVYISNQKDGANAAKMPIANEKVQGTEVTAGSKAVVETYSPNKVLYCMPNSQTGDDKATMLVILGKFYPKGTNSKVAYYVRYALNLNKNVSAKKDGTVDNSAAETGTTMNAVYPNREYKIDLTLKSIGDPSLGSFDPTNPSTDDGGGTKPGGTVPDPPKPVQNMTANITVSVKNWIQVGQSVDY